MKKIILATLLLALTAGGSILHAEPLPSEKEVGASFQPGIKWFDKVHMAGFVDTYYSHNFNKPDSRVNQMRNFDVYSNQFSLNMAEFVFHKNPEPAGFRVDLDFGTTADMVHGGVIPAGGGAAAGADDTYRNIQQAYISYASPAGVTVDLGKFVTHMGLEVIETRDNMNYSRSLLFAWAIPYYHTGVRANYRLNDSLFLNGYVYNGWNNVIENNGKKTYGLQAGWTPMEKMPLVLNWTGPEEAAGIFRDRQVYDFIATYNLSDRVTLLANYDLGRQEDMTGGTMSWRGAAIYGKFAVNDSLAIVPRYEWYDDTDGATTGFAQVLQELTLTAELNYMEGVLTRVEYRRDWSDMEVFDKEDGKSGMQNTLAIGMVFAF